MADKDSLIEYVRQLLGPNLQQLVDQAEEELAQDPDVTPEVLEELLANLEYVAENPDEYKDVVQAAVQAGAIDPEDAPPEFDPAFVGIMILAIQELMARKAQGFKKGGLAQMAKHVAKAGRKGDTMLAHINPKEAEVLRRMGGSGTVNPNTGLREYKGGIGKIFKSVGKAVGKVFKAVSKVAKFALPAIANYFVPGSGWVVGALQGGMEGGLKGAVLGGLGGYMSGADGMGFAGQIGDYAKRLPFGIGTTLANTIGTEALGASILGGASSAIMGKNPLTGAITAGLTSKFTPEIGGALSKIGLSNNMVGMGVQQANVAAQTGGNPITGLAGGMLAGGATDLAGKFGFPGAQPAGGSDTVPAQQSAYDVYSADQLANPGQQLLGGGQSTNMPSGVTNTMGMQQLAPNFNTNGAPNVVGNYGFQAAPQSGNVFSDLLGSNASGSSAGGGFGDLFSGKNLLMAGAALSALGGMAPQQAMMQLDQAQMTPEQKEAMQRGLTNYIAAWNPTVLPNPGTPEYDAMMRYIQQGKEINFMAPSVAVPASAPITAARGGYINKARGGALGQYAAGNLVMGPGHGRKDAINARLSDGEYVIDAETVALLGNGSTKAGALALDDMRKNIRQQKGKALAKGKFSPDAKSPLAYMKGGLK